MASPPVPIALPVAVLVLLAVAVLGPVEVAAQSAHPFDPAAVYRVPLGDGAARGPADAPVTIVEFSDFGCPYCGRSQATLDQLARLYPGEIRVVFRHNPLDIDDGTLAAEATEAAREQGQFWPMHDLVFAAGGVVTRAELDDFAVQLGLDLGRFRRALAERRGLPRIQADHRQARALGATSTPVFFVNGRPVKGALPLAVFVAVVEEELARARALRDRGVTPDRLYEALTASGLRRADPGGDAIDYDLPRLEPDRLYRVGLGLPGHTVGPADALLTVVVFSDFECGYCAQLAPVLAGMRTAYPDDLRIAFRHLPLGFHPRAQLAAEAVVAAAAQGELWAMHDAIFADIEHLDRDHLERRAQAIGLDMARFRAALDDRRYHDAVSADAAAANALGVFGTPTLFINGTPVQGVAPLDFLQETFLEPKLAEARAMIAAGVARRDLYATLMKRAGHTEIGVAMRFPTTRGTLPMDRGDYRAAVMHACRARDRARAQDMYEKLGAGRQHDDVRVDCRTHGVDLEP